MNLDQLGMRVKRPTTLDDAVAFLQESSFEFSSNLAIKITVKIDNFTSLCPATGLPDFGDVVIRYTPKYSCIENNAVKFYLWLYRDKEMPWEEMAVLIAKDIHEAINPKYLQVTINHDPKGDGVDLTVSVEM